MASTDTSPGALPVAKLTLGFLVAVGLVRTVLLGTTGGITALGFTLAGSARPWTLAAAGSKVWLIAIDVVTVLLVARLLTRESSSLRDLLEPRPYGKNLLYAIAALVVIYLALALGGFIGNFLIYYGAPTATDTVDPPVWIGVLRAVVAPITVAVAEESLFRGYLIPRLRVHLGRVGAVIVAALLAATQSFALNIGNTEAMLAGFISAFVIALAFGGLYLWFKRIAPLILVHWLFEAIVGVLVLVSALHGVK
jgi:membrane protease YdiL (CAAX protease family)